MTSVYPTAAYVSAQHVIIFGGEGGGGIITLLVCTCNYLKAGVLEHATGYQN